MRDKFDRAIAVYAAVMHGMLKDITSPEECADLFWMEAPRLGTDFMYSMMVAALAKEIITLLEKDEHPNAPESYAEKMTDQAPSSRLKRRLVINALSTLTHCEDELQVAEKDNFLTGMVDAGLIGEEDIRGEHMLPDTCPVPAWLQRAMTKAKGENIGLWDIQEFYRFLHHLITTLIDKAVPRNEDV
ncbi:hypothetical protein DFP72DRAFT_851173 [Ephemerocybe angulata]|uniref:Uncharacterized protein n=1 Tax=Ephemerocybe angulata TaxID=980116 RepID=A0A8H6M2L2_9AGAR|nr:hypothetical protein DFP72DRAFT_851173 [Tulosesus angulatus]